MTIIIWALIFALILIMLGIVCVCIFDEENLGFSLMLVGGILAGVMFVMTVVSLINKVCLDRNGYDFSQINEDIIVISSYNNKPNKTSDDYAKLVDKVENYNTLVDNAKKAFDFYNVDYPEQMNTYKIIYYDYENNVAKWETGGIVTW